MKLMKYFVVFMVLVFALLPDYKLLAQGSKEIDELLQKASESQQKREKLAETVKSLVDLSNVEFTKEGENPEYNEGPTTKDRVKEALTSQKLYENLLDFIDRMGVIIMTRPNHVNAFNKIIITGDGSWSNGYEAGLLIVILSLVCCLVVCMGLTVRPLEMAEYIGAKNGYCDEPAPAPVVKERAVPQRRVILVKTSFEKNRMTASQPSAQGQQSSYPVRKYGSSAGHANNAEDEAPKSVWPQTKTQFMRYGQKAMMNLKNFVSDEQFQVIYAYNKDAKPFFNRRVMEMAIENADRSLEYYEDNGGAQADLLNIIINSKVSNLYAGKKVDHHNASVAGLDVAMGLALGDRQSIPGMTQDTTLWSDSWR